MNFIPIDIEKITRQYHEFREKVTDGSLKILEHLGEPVVRVIVFLGIVGIIAEKSFLSSNNNWRTFAGFLFLFLGITLVFRMQDGIGNLATAFIIFFLVLGSLYWRFQGYDTDGFTIGGVLPSSDAGGYFAGATNILYGEAVPPYAAYRPLFSSFLSVILFITGQDLILSLITLASIVSLAIFILALEARKSVGVLPAVLVIVIMIYCYTGRFAGKFMTEQIGIPLGMLSLAFLLRGSRLKNIHYAALGVLLMSLAQNTRAGALFVLPLLILWGSFGLEKPGFSGRRFVILSIIGALGFLLTYWSFTSNAAPGSVPFGNFGSTLYGMATGYRGWRVWYAEFPGASDTEAMKNSLQIISESPTVFLTAVFSAYRDFLSPVYFFSNLYLPLRYLAPLAYPLSGFTLIGVWRLVQNKESHVARMLLCVLAGILISIPFAPPPDDGARAMTATTCFLGLIAGCGISGPKPTQTLETNTDNRIRIDAPTGFSIILILSTAFGWLPIKGILDIPTQRISCNQNEQPVTLITNPGSYINVLPKNDGAVSFLSNTPRNILLDNLSNFPDVYLWGAFRNIEPGQSLLTGINFANQGNGPDSIWLVVPTSSIQNFNGTNVFCALQTGNPDLDRVGFLFERTIENTFIPQ